MVIGAAPRSTQQIGQMHPRNLARAAELRVHLHQERIARGTGLLLKSNQCGIRVLHYRCSLIRFV